MEKDYSKMTVEELLRHTGRMIKEIKVRVAKERDRALQKEQWEKLHK